MGLIDTDKLIEDIHKRNYISKALSEIFETIIDEQPTAYDIDEVVEQLEKRIRTHERCIEYEKKNGTITEEFQQRKAVEVLKDAIEIVKAGVKNE